VIFLDIAALESVIMGMLVEDIPLGQEHLEATGTGVREAMAIGDPQEEALLVDRDQ